MTSIDKLKALINKINNRCNPNDFPTFDHLLEHIKKTAFGKQTSFLTPEEIMWVKKNPQIEQNIMKMCQKFAQKSEKNVEHTETTEYILNELGLSHGTKVDPPENVKFMMDPKLSGLVKDTIEEVLVLLDLSAVPYR